MEEEEEKIEEFTTIPKVVLRCLAVDDENLALDLVEDNIAKVPFLKLEKRMAGRLEKKIRKK